MNPEVADMGLKVSEQSDQLSSSYTHHSFRGPEPSSTGQQAPRDMAMIPDEKQRISPVDTVDVAAGDLLKSAVEDGPDEDSPLVEGKAQSAQFRGLDIEIFEKEKKTGDLRRRSKQAVLHLTFTEMRITQMEEQIQKLKAELHNKPAEFQISVAWRQAPTYKSIIKRSSHGEFLLNPQSVKIPCHEQASLEVLVVHQQTPERLRIRYAPVIKALEKVCRETLSNYTFWPNDLGGDRERTGCTPTVLLRPWKLLVAYEKEIRDSLENIDAFVQPARREDASGGTSGTRMLDNFEFKREDLLRELKLLVNFLDVDLKPTFDLRREVKEGTAIEIEYGDLWHLFELGDTVVSPNNKTQAFRVVNFTGGREVLIQNLVSDEHGRHPQQAQSVGGFAVDCCSLRFDGTNYVPVLEKFLIRKYHGRRPITSLEIFPLKFDQESAARYREFETQGQRYLSLTQVPFSHRMFRGRTRDEPPQQLDTQVIVDVTLAINTEPDWQVSSRISIEDFTKFDERETRMPAFCYHGIYEEGHCGSDYVFKDLTMKRAGMSPSNLDVSGLLRPRRAEDLKQEDMILLPAWVHAFVLRSRQWVTLNTGDLSEVQFDNNFDELMFSPSHKQTIVALVETHENARTSPMQRSHSVGPALDLVRGKGAGLVILLHGEPGVGKTSTAECVADATKRPLFPITCGDIGETAMQVEKNLHHNFSLAYKWGCVLLLDEADIFLAKRSKNGLTRNAVTSVFLRSLEYYAGILFLTTNRVGSIDPAFKSRIQLSLYYPRIDLETTVKLYEVFLQRARDEQKRIGVTQFKIKQKDILKFAARHYRRLQKEGYSTWNGRQIRNACQTAIALVEHQAAHLEAGQPMPVLGRQHFETVAEGSKEFDRYLRRTLLAGDEEIARRDQWRNDYFQEADITRPPSVHPPLPKPSSYRPAPLAVTDSDSASSDDSETESNDEDDGNIKHAAEGGIGQVDAAANVDEDDAEFQEFLRFKAMKAKNKGK